MDRKFIFAGVFPSLGPSSATDSNMFSLWGVSRIMYSSKVAYFCQKVEKRLGSTRLLEKECNKAEVQYVASQKPLNCQKSCFADK